MNRDGEPGLLDDQTPSGSRFFFFLFPFRSIALGLSVKHAW